MPLKKSNIYSICNVVSLIIKQYNQLGDLLNACRSDERSKLHVFCCCCVGVLRLIGTFKVNLGALS